ncbi:MAG: peptidylprolyl isomerase [Bryobacteraceae bacterium]
MSRLGVLLLLASACVRAEVAIVIRTELGAIEAVLDDKRAPVTVSNLLKYVDAGHFNGGQFFRTVRSSPDNQPQTPVKIDVVQAAVKAEFGDKGFPPIPLERTRDTGLKHVNGALSMARGGPDTAAGSFSICIGDQPELDFGGKRQPDGQGFAVFGRVTAGMDVARKIHESPAGPSNAKGVAAGNQRLTPPIRILSIHRK